MDSWAGVVKAEVVSQTGHCLDRPFLDSTGQGYSAGHGFAELWEMHARPISGNFRDPVRLMLLSSRFVVPPETKLFCWAIEWRKELDEGFSGRPIAGSNWQADI